MTILKFLSFSLLFTSSLFCMDQQEELIEVNYSDAGQKVGKLDIKILKAEASLDLVEALRRTQEKEELELPIIRAIESSVWYENDIMRAEAFQNGYLKALKDFNCNEWMDTMNNKAAASVMLENYTTLINFVQASIESLTQRKLLEYKAVQEKKAAADKAKKYAHKTATELFQNIESQFGPQDLDAVTAPLAHCVSVPDKTLCCLACRSKETATKPLFQCSRCKSAHYCSKECQIRNWHDGHKAVCAKKQVNKNLN